MCEYQGCGLQASFGKRGERGNRKYCSRHKPDETYISLSSRLCIHPGCPTIASFGKIENRRKEYCFKHKPDDTFINFNNRKVMLELRKNKIKKPIRHRNRGTYINYGKTCKIQNCKNVALYGKKNENYVEYCKVHRPDRSYVNFRYGLCKTDGCPTQASFGKRGSTNREYCSKHKPDATYVSLSNVPCKCCNNHAYYGRVEIMKVEYCEKHIPNDKYVHIRKYREKNRIKPIIINDNPDNYLDDFDKVNISIEKEDTKILEVSRPVVCANVGVNEGVNVSRPGIRVSEVYTNIEGGDTEIEDND